MELDKFGGVGLKNIMLIWIVCCIFTLMAKVIFIKHDVEGISDFFKAL